MKLLIVDDEYIAVEGVMNGVNWDALGFEQVFQSYSYSEAVEILQKTYVEVLVCDIEMPDGTGLELVEWVNAHSPGTQCIIMSCHDEFDYARQALSLRCLDYVLKPVRYPTLTAILKKAMETVEERRHRERMQNFGQQYIEMVSGKNSDDYEDAVEKVEHYIREHLAEELSVRNLADMVYIGADHLTRSFKKRYGKNGHGLYSGTADESGRGAAEGSPPDHHHGFRCRRLRQLFLLYRAVQAHLWENPQRIPEAVPVNRSIPKEEST